ncbi:GRIP and coiled-coil domain-containing protein 1 isoform X2 [Anolis carolinensis]|uniref:GRIP and coiled-coil domain-containing protein 1 isoform X2 n=1 Tax=Anolis carolinensis TaxID=28377 RepID=UPI002F2B4CAB
MGQLGPSLQVFWTPAPSIPHSRPIHPPSPPPPVAMEKFGVSFGGGPSRKELLETVEQQREQLAQYQARLKDVVRAYKGLLKEKEALEASLRVLSVAHQPDTLDPAGPGTTSGSSLDLGEDRSSGHSEEDGAGPVTEEEEQAVGPEEESGSGGEAPGDGGRRVLQLQAQLSTLTASLATVSQEKSRAEASFQADKRRQKQEREEASRRAEEERGRLAEEARAAREQLAETKARLLAQQHDRAQEQADHAAMLRELQRLLQAERALRQEAERSLEESRGALAGKACAADRAEEAEHRARRLQREMEGLEKELAALREESARPDPQLQALQSEMAALRSHFQAQLLQEMRKMAQTEERVRAEEDRAAGLEAQISEASELLGSYERAKQRDQLAMQRLRERLSQLDLENKTLALATSSRCPVPDVGLDESGLDANVLRDRIEKLRALLRAATKQDLEEEDGEDEGGEGSLCKAEPPGEEADGEKVSSAAYYQRELKQLKEEFEHYKQQQQQHWAQKGGGQPAQGGTEGTVEGELAEVRAQLAALKETYVSLRLSHEDQARRHREQAEARRQEASRGQQRQREELERARREAREEALHLEEELRRQRERALAVLAEKELELEHLRALAWPYAAGPSPPGHRPPSPTPPPSLPPSAPQEDLTQALRLSGGPGEPPFLLYTEQLARRAVELAGLKREKRRLEGEARRLRERLLAAEEAHREELAALRERLQQSAREQGREGANLEYLKNVFFRFLTLAEGMGRQQTLGAILTVLHFSPEERQAVLGPGGAGGGGGGWWASGRR